MGGGGNPFPMSDEIPTVHAKYSRQAPAAKVLARIRPSSFKSASTTEGLQRMIGKFTG